MSIFYLKRLLLPALILAVSACQTLPKSETSGSPGSGTSQVLNTPSPTEGEILWAYALETDKQWAEAALSYRELAEKSAQPERSAFYIKSALMLYYSEQYLLIEPFFESLQEQDILPQDANYKATILAGSYLGNGKIYQSLLALPTIDDVIDYRYKVLALNIRSKGVLAIGKPMESASLRMQISQYLKTDEEIESNHDFIWDALNRISERIIIRNLSEPQTPETRGWLELNLIARRSNMLPAKIEPWINQWYQLYSDHVAGRHFAIGLLEESRRIYIKPARIAVMLPFSGRLEKVAKAIQNGFLYAYYQDKTSEAEVEIINASDNASEFNLQYRQAIQNGADFIVGPVNKELVNLIQAQENIEVPTLTLNYADDSSLAKLNLYQFGLSPEDEAEQIADYALADGNYRAVTLVPDTDWGNRLRNAFTNRFESLGGRVVGGEVYPSKRNDYSAAIMQLLNLSSSNQRHQMIQDTIGQAAKFDARRRQDIDMIFIAANSRQARLIKPQLKFHRAQGVPVYATSHISSSQGNSDDDQDLNEILFVDTPWLLDSRSNLDYGQIEKLWPNDSKLFSRLFALGIDAYRLIPSLRRLMIHPSESVPSHTGELFVDSKGRVKRSLLMATYEKGIARLVKPIANATRTDSKLP